ncbi:MAG: metallophosphoesterase [Proteobacteria bacterium]|nr:metallophosphoesterase [Pseudomonadota bacterium]
MTAILVIAGVGAPVRAAPLVSERAPWDTQLVLAPRIADQIGALAVSGLDVVAGRTLKPVAVLGDAPPPPARWPFAVDVPGTSLQPTAPPDRRIATLYATTTFTLTERDQGLQVLELRLRFEDSARVWLNGTEVVREALTFDGATALADRPHGPEWQTFFLPVGPWTLRLGDNVLAIEVHASGRHLAPSLAAELIGRRALVIRRGPRIAELGATTARIVADTDPHVAAELAWNALGSTDVHRVVSPPGEHHVFALANLPARSQIEYRVVVTSNGPAGASTDGPATLAHRFHTQPAAGDPIRIGVYGDVRGGHDTHRKIVDQMLGEGLDVVAVTGDMVLHGSDEADWQRFHAITAELVASVPYLPVVGNHDLGWDGSAEAGDEARAGERLAMPTGPPGRPAGTYWYSVDLADVHLVFLDSNAYDRREQEVWLAQDLAAARSRAKKVRAIFAFTHDGPYSRGIHRGNAIARARYVPILVGAKVDMLFSGHDHMYQRGELGGLRYVVTGGGGSSLYGLTCGVDGKPACKEDGMRVVFREFHYVTVVVERGGAIEMCPRKPDGSKLEACTRWKPSSS